MFEEAKRSNGRFADANSMASDGEACRRREASAQNALNQAHLITFLTAALFGSLATSNFTLLK